jgi:hypothetical protein
MQPDLRMVGANTSRSAKPRQQVTKNATQRSSPRKRSSSAFGQIDVDTGTKEPISAMQRKFEESVKRSSSVKQGVAHALEFNRHLTTGYHTMVRVVVDATQLLRRYVDFFDSIHKYVAAMDASFNDDTLQNLEYINALTRENVSQIEAAFRDQVKELIPLYKTHDQMRDAEMLQRALEEFGAITNAADKVVNYIGKRRAATESPSQTTRPSSVTGNSRPAPSATSPDTPAPARAARSTSVPGARSTSAPGTQSTSDMSRLANYF